MHVQGARLNPLSLLSPTSLVLKGLDIAKEKTDIFLTPFQKNSIQPILLSYVAPFRRNFQKKTPGQCASFSSLLCSAVPLMDMPDLYAYLSECPFSYRIHPVLKPKIGLNLRFYGVSHDYCPLRCSSNSNELIGQTLRDTLYVGKRYTCLHSCIYRVFH